MARGLKRAVLRERTQAAAAAVREGEAEIDALRTDLASRRLLEEAGFYSHTAITRADHELRAAEERKEKLERDRASETAVKNGAEIDIGFDDDSGPKLGLLEGAVLATKREMQSAALDLASAKKHLRTLLDSEAALASASNGLRKATLVAGQSGRINTVLVGSGSEVPAGERLASLVDCHHPYALGVIPERHGFEQIQYGRRAYDYEFAQEISCLKVFASETALKVAQALQILAGAHNGYVRAASIPIERTVRDLLAAPLMYPNRLLTSAIATLEAARIRKIEDPII